MTTRRQFIGSALAAGALAAAGCQTTGSGGKREIVDEDVRVENDMHRLPAPASRLAFASDPVDRLVND